MLKAVHFLPNSDSIRIFTPKASITFHRQLFRQFAENPHLGDL